MIVSEKQVIQGPLKGKNLQVFKRDIVIQGDISECNFFCDGDISVEGSIYESRLQTSGGSLMASGQIKDSVMEVFSDVYALALTNSDIKCTYGSVYIADFIHNSKIHAMHLIHSKEGSGEILGSQLSASIEIYGRKIGALKNQKPCTLTLRPRNKQNMFELFFIYKQKLGSQEKELATLSRYIKVFSLIKDKIKDLPGPKKTELLKKVTEYKTLKQKIDAIKEERRRFFIQSPEEDKYNRSIIADDTIYPPANIIIDGKSYQLKTPEKTVGFYKSGIILQGELEKILNKRKITQLSSRPQYQGK